MQNFFYFVELLKKRNIMFFSQFCNQCLTRAHSLVILIRLDIDFVLQNMRKRVKEETSVSVSCE